MNTKNNRRRRKSVENIQQAFMELLETQELKDISVSDLCKRTSLNRSTFYANFLDVYDLADKLRARLEQEFSALFDEDARLRGSDSALRMFHHIRDNQLLYKTYFKLGYDQRNPILIYDTYDAARAEQDFGNKNIRYHMEFFRGGINAIIKFWL